VFHPAENILAVDCDLLESYLVQYIFSVAASVIEVVVASFVSVQGSVRPIEDVESKLAERTLALGTIPSQVPPPAMIEKYETVLVAGTPEILHYSA